MAADMNNKAEDKLEFDFGNNSDNEEINVNNEEIDNTDIDDHHHLDLNDDFNINDLDLNFDEEEKADEEELNAIKQRKKDKIQDQIDPFSDNIENNNINTNNIKDTDNNIDINTDINESVVQIDDDNLSDGKAQSDIIKMDEEIDNINLFMKHMEKRGYQFESSRFLTKKFAESSDMDTIYNINITINNEIITAITGYDSNNKIITVPNSIITTVQKDIQESLKQII